MSSRPQKNPLIATLIGFVAFATMLSAAPVTAAGLLPSLATKTPAAATEPPEPELIPATEIPVRADADERFAQQVTQRAKQQDPTATLVPRLRHLTGGVLNLAAVFQKEEVPGIPVVRLEGLERHWKFYDRQLETWRRDLERITAAYSADAAELSSRRAIWEATQVMPGLAPALATRAGAIATQLGTAEQAVSGPLGAQLQLGRKANALQARIDSGLKALGAAIRHYDQRLLAIDMPPLWEIVSDPHYSNDDAVSAARAGLGVEWEFLEEYVAAYKPRLILNGVLGLLLLPMLLWLSVRGRRLISDDPKLQSSAHVFTRPLSAWLVVTLVSIPLVLPDAPLVVHQVALLLALIPVLRLLPDEVYRALGPTPYLATGLYLFSHLSFLLIGHALFFRLHLQAVSVLALLGMVWLLLRRPTRILTPRTLTAATWRFLGFAAVAALLVAIVANVVGNVSLADVLTGAVVVSAYVGLALHAGASVLASIARLLLARQSVTRFRVVTQRTGPLLKALGKLIRLGALAIWVLVTLDAFRVLRPVTNWLKVVLTYPIEAGHISVTLGSIVMFALSVWVAFWFARSIRAVLQDDVLPKMDLPRGVGNSVSTLSYYAMVTAGLLIALAAAGFETSQFAIIFGALSVGIGFGLQTVVNNFVSGLILMFERPIQPGDVVEVSGTSGKVREIGMRATTLTTFDGADVVVPNGTLLSEKLINWTLSDMNRRIDVDVGVAYGSDPRRVMELLAQVAASIPGVAPDPVPAVVFLRFGASSLDFGIRAWTNNFDEWVSIRSAMTIGIYDALRAEGIEIPFPQQALHLRSVSPEASAQLALGQGRAAVPPTKDAGTPPAAVATTGTST